MIDDMSFQSLGAWACCDDSRLRLALVEQSRIYSRGYYADDKLVHVKNWSGSGYLETFLLAPFTRT
jgi:hypothetical protein